MIKLTSIYCPEYWSSEVDTTDEDHVVAVPRSRPATPEGTAGDHPAKLSSATTSGTHTGTTEPTLETPGSGQWVS